MTTTDKIDELLAALDAGMIGADGVITGPHHRLIRDVFPTYDADDVGAAEWFVIAVDGSRDAAANLHRMVLPTWRASLREGGNRGTPAYVTLYDERDLDDSDHIHCAPIKTADEIPARAWLVTILLAMKAERQTGERGK